MLPIEGGHAVGESAQSRAAAGVGAADPVVGDLDHGVAVDAAHAARVAWLAWAYLTTLVSASATTK